MKIVHPDKSSYKRGLVVSAGLYCVSCQALVREVLKKLHWSHSDEADILEAFDKICQNKENFLDDR